LGSNSFSGASFVNYALDSDFYVIGISRSEQLNNVFLSYSENSSKHDSFQFYQYDLNKDIDKIINLIKKEQPNYIFNFAAQSMVAESWENPTHWMMTNVVSTTVLFDRLKGLDFIKKYIHITTPEVYGSCSGHVTENTLFNPSTPYAVSRAAGDMSLKTYVDTYEFPAVSTRAANVYGAGQQLYRIIPRTILYIKQGKKLRLHGGGHSERSFIHINDVSDATLKIALNGKVGETYHISTNETITIQNLVRLICSKMDVKFDDYVEVVGDRPGKDAAYLLSSEKIRNQLSWKDMITLDNGIDEVIRWVDSNLSVIDKEPDHYIHKQ
jgi:dTDP-glucose 4,6-dehydratase